MQCYREIQTSPLVILLFFIYVLHMLGLLLTERIYNRVTVTSDC